MSEDKLIYAIRVEGDVDIYGQSCKRDRIIGLYDTVEKVEEAMRKIYSNPYFCGSLSIVTFSLNEDLSGYSKYSGSKIVRESK